MKKQFLYILLYLSLFYAPKFSGQVINNTELNNKIDALIPKMVNDSTPGLVIGIIKNGKLIFSKGYGMANLSYHIKNNPKMVYNIGSVSKQFLGYAFAMLHVRGDLNIDDPVSKYLDDWPDFNKTVTLRHLLTHTSGYREAYAMSDLAGRIVGIDRLYKKECLTVVRKQPSLEFKPGSRWTYNSTAWVILAEVLKKVTGQSAEEWVKQNILIPLGMKDTQIESYVGEVIYNAAESYTYDKEKGYTNKKSNRAIFGAADIYSNIPDLAKWINNFKTAKVGGKKVNKLFLEPYILNDGTNSEYALGIFNSTYRGLKCYRHTGHHEAFATQLVYFPEQDLGIVTISNFGKNAWFKILGIADILLDKYMIPLSDKNNQSFNISKNHLKRLAGLYINSLSNRVLSLSINENTLSIDGKAKLTPISQKRFLINKINNDSIQFINISKEKTQFVFTKDKESVYTKVEKWIPVGNDLKSYEGDYRSNELETVYHLILKEHNLIIRHRWLGEIKLKPVTKDFFKTSMGFYVKFNRNNNGYISNMSINYGRTLNVIFNRIK